ncbi:MAG TPA: HD domain-containing phosphohydrolase [Usitatibacteraceae bacterium]|nr:HD domain-containing phosphohydrolase [Usitatibacteraceae bacterium]
MPEAARGEPLSLLVVEDSASDAGLMVRHLERNGFDVADRRVETEDELRAALREGPWDVVLCDFNVPGFDAGAALAALHETGLDIPFIVVSGVIVEGAAIELMRAGASDYVMKENLARLAPVVRREVEEARGRAASRRAQAALAATLQRHAAAIDSALDGYAALDGGHRILEVNDALSAMTGRSREELLQLRVDELFAAGAIAASQAFPSREGGGHARFDSQWRRKDGSTLDVELSVTCHGGEDIEIFLFAHDITMRKQREAELGGLTRESERARLALLGVLEDQREIAEELRESEEQFRGMLEHNVSAMFLIEDGNLTYANPRTGEILGYTSDEMTGKPFISFVVDEDRQMIARVVEQLISGKLGKAERNFKAIRKDGSHVDIGASATRAMLRGKVMILGAAQDIGERKKAREEIDRYIVRLESSMQGTLEAVSHMVELRDPYTSGHERRVGDLAAAIAAEMGLPDAVIKGLRLTGYVHDIGKISIPAEILSKPGRLTPLEYELIKSHSQAGFEVLKGVDFPWPVAEAILQHHERADGSGYPRGLKGEEIILEARVIAVADVLEAMGSHRPYRPSLGLEAALAEIEKNAGRLYDATAAAACLRLFREKGYSLGA